MKNALLIVTVFMLTGCSPNQRIIDSVKNDNRGVATTSPAPGASATPAESNFEKDLEAMRTVDFNYIYVLRRRDRGVMDDTDKTFIYQNTPSEINRKRLSDGGRAVILGSNFRLPPEAVKLFKDRYVFEDLSKPEVKAGETNSATSNSNGRR
jgi:hypothetical protein